VGADVSLDRIAEDPKLVSRLTAEAAAALVLKAASVQSALASRLATPCASSKLDPRENAMRVMLGVAMLAHYRAGPACELGRESGCFANSRSDEMLRLASQTP